MTSLSNLRNLVTNCRAGRAGLGKQPQSFRPALEALESRDAPSGLGHATDFNLLLGDSTGKGQGDGFAIIGGHGHNVIYLPGN